MKSNRRFTMSASQARGVEVSKAVKSNVESQYYKFLGARGTNIGGMSGSEIVQSVFGRGINELSREEYAAFRQAIEGTEVEDRIEIAREEALMAEEGVTASDAASMEVFLKGYERDVERFSEMFSSVGGSNITGEAIAAMADAASETDPERALVKRGKAQDILMKTGDMDKKAAATVMRGFEVNATKESGYFSEMQKNLRGVAYYKAKMGRNIFQRGLLTDIESAKGVSQKARDKALLVASKVEDAESFLALSSSEIKDLGGAAGAGVKEIYSGLKDLEELESGKASGSKARSILNAIPGLNDERVKEKIISIVEKSGGGRAVGEAFNAAMSSFTPGEIVSAHGSPSASEGSTGTEILITQTNINRQILSALSAMNSMIRGAQ